MMRRSAPCWLLAGLLLLTLAGATTPVLAGGAWSHPVRLWGWGNRSGGWFPAIAADRYGNLHAVWQGGGPAAATLSKPSNAKAERLSQEAGWLLYSRWDGQAWSAPNEIGATAFEGNAIRSALAVDSQNRLHLLFRGLDLAAPKPDRGENEPQRHLSADSLQAERASDWKPGRAISRRTPAYFSDLVIDSRDIVHAVWTEYDGQSYGVYYRRSLDGGQSWSPPHAIDSALPVLRWRLQLKLDHQDRLHLVYEVVDGLEADARVSNGFVYAWSSDHGLSWSKRPFLPARTYGVYERAWEGFGWRQQPTVGVDRRGRVVLVWREDGSNRIYSQHSADGESWSAPEPMSGLTHGVARPFDRYDMAADSAGQLHFVGVGYPTGSNSMALLHLEWGGYGWSEPATIYLANAGVYPEWPRVAVAGGNQLHVVWFGGDSESVDRKPIGIWHSWSQLSAPAVAPALRPSPSPTAAVSGGLEQPRPPGPDASTTHATDEPGSDGPVPAFSASAEHDSAQAIVASLLAASLLVAGAYGLRRLRILQ